MPFLASTEARVTYAAPSIRNAMTDLIRDTFSQYEMRMTDTTDGLAFQKICLDEVVPGEERMLRIEAIADPIAKSPEQIYIEQETLRELFRHWTKSVNESKPISSTAMALLTI